MAPKFTEKRVGQFMFDQFEKSFASRVMERRKEIELKARAVYKEFFKEMAGLVGVDQAPEYLGVDWAPLSDSWIDRKGYPYDTRYYEGLGPKSGDKFQGGSFHDEIRSKSPAQRYGPLNLSVKAGRSGTTYDPRARRFRYKGRFTSGADAGVTVVINAFPWVKNDKDLQRGFSPRVQNILERNEPWGSSNLKGGVRRPFLTPMARYYTQVKLPDAVREAVR